MTHLEQLESLPPEIITNFLDTGKSEALSKELQCFIMQLQWAIEIRETERNMNRAAKTLKERIYCVQKLRISLATAKKRIADALEYFSVDEQIAQHIWDRDTANKLEDIAKLAIALNKPREAKSCMLEANELRKRANEAAASKNQQAPLFLISNKLTHEDMHFEKENLKQIAKKHNEGFYLDVIKSLPVDDKEKERLMKDADIIDVETVENE